jgi:ubiquinol-cytochrome c reductase cytochrome c1 subunit
MAKDVATFLNWAAEPEHDERKKLGLKAVILFSSLTVLSVLVKRFKWTVIKNRKIREPPPVSFLTPVELICTNHSLQASRD